jgi:hypothetical protein
MTVDSTKLAYYSGWDIDQLLASSSASVGTGDTAVYTISGAVSVPVFALQFQPSGSAFWYDNGTSSTDGTLAGLFTVYSYISGNTLFINTTTAGTARYFVWADKVNY